MHRLYRAVKLEELRRLLRAGAYARAGAWRWRCGLCGRRLRSLRALERHASLKHAREYREAVRRALLEVRLRYGGVPRWFAECYAMSLFRRPTLEKKTGAPPESDLGAA
jgi:3-methyladenine DNA glycosylase/8-oxoguanine DNA glycosylase